MGRVNSAISRVFRGRRKRRKRVKAVVLLDEKEIGDKAVETALKECVNTLVNTVKFYILVTV